MSDFSILSETGYGVGVHWTKRTWPMQGVPVDFERAVEDFDVEGFVDQVQECGAGHVLFTGLHLLCHFAGPNRAMDNVLEGYTCRHDLVGEIAEKLARHDIRFILYFNDATGGDYETPWCKAISGGPDQDSKLYFHHYINILRELGVQYGDLVDAFWIDRGYHLERCGAPWRELYQAAKVGNSKRLVTWNTGVQRHLYWTEYQDFWSGEIWDLRFRPRGQTTPFGFPWYAYASWQHMQPLDYLGGRWGMFSEQHRYAPWDPVEPELVADFIRSFQSAGGTATINLLISQEGTIVEADLENMCRCRRLLE